MKIASKECSAIAPTWGRNRNSPRVSICLFCISILVFLFPSESAPWDSTGGEIAIVRQIPPQAAPSQTIAVEIALDVGTGITDSIKGFYLTDQIPEDLTIETGSHTVTLNGIELTNIIEEIGWTGDVYPGAVPYRLILETPPDFVQENPLQAGDELVLTYYVTVPTGVASGTEYTLPGYNWVGRIVSDPAEDIFGYEDLEVSITVVDLGDLDCDETFTGADVLVQASLVVELIECTDLPPPYITSCQQVLARSDWDCDGTITGTDVLIGASIIVNIVGEEETPLGQGCP